ncbi:SDR family NAD(P)-dependent oxidoreductase [Marinobacter sp. tcs-11]|uniref:SDR family NAD(P)-dependent oxidoreductase n=1 Tax=Marinobacter sp. tcs-11 TaxID=1742860 RepID=UPI00257A5B0D|nr:SDR family NAD(P)-dependent oxidoreductase [Marinobacter sp. tcs-11]
MKAVLITGASSGIGKALSYQFAAEGHNLVITARRQDELDKIKQDIESRYSVKVIVKVSDLAVDGAADRLYEKLRAFDIEAMINNAGFGDFAMPWEMDLAKAQTMVDLNVRALTTLPLHYARDYSDSEATLLNVSSIGGYTQFDVAVTYWVTKFYVASFTEGLAQSLADQSKSMRAKVLAPGPTESEFVTHSSEKGAIDGDDLFPESAFITAEQLAQYAYQLFESDQVVGIINGENHLELKEPIYPYAQVPH